MRSIQAQHIGLSSVQLGKSAGAPSLAYHSVMSENSIDVDEVARYLADFYDGERIDWDDALSRVENVFNVDLPESMLDPLITKIKRTYQAEVRARRG
jgi:hypothetical protein